ncbi:GH92 family glycosyl hydrolase [Mucilaginibacter sp. BJC16-A38]|uniref:GH92 family glycosyl hydrolase n=1 Tax=Mucilaginibacter phenanthrenivorans TaxID=1234842 RepID=UPI002157E1F6|nr:GH92 family glycosyl hydrolase [Mucilaginibacter phenanthrenivorans]MCR8556598.1 GH92 family glycosyl hydrolase [Mucilaginibacter phenanthrenivorans]
MKTRFKFAFATVLALFSYGSVSAQHANHLQYVNPFIGTAKSSVITKWGSEGGTYPGAVAPSGFIQLSPETRFAKGYDYEDSAICYFSCYRHMSGFPEGSSGHFYVMPVKTNIGFDAHTYSRKFSHTHETANPGYYKVIFDDDHTIAEATTTARTGLFRFTFAAGSKPDIFIGDAKEIKTVSPKVLQASNGNTVINFTEAYIDKRQVNDGWIFTFASATKGEKVIELKLSASPVGYASAQNNIDKEIGALSFEQIRKHTSDDWLKKLAVIDVTDGNERNKTVFYTALYHSLLIPWVVDDADGQYIGADAKVHQKSGGNEYGAFSPWDTFRSLHPLLTLLYPDKQKDVILSMLDIYTQTGHLPIESMTGNHTIPIIVDSYLKGITGFDKELAYKAMKKSILEPPFIQTDMEVYNQIGYIPFTRSESVTRTVEYAYDDWALSQFAKDVIGNDKEYQLLAKRGNNYRNLLNNDELLLLPRNNEEFKLQPGMSGYKEGDKWVYSYFVPQNAKDLINLTGGNRQFAHRLDSALENEVILFDNETVFHLPYLFNQASKPALTQKWVRQIMLNRFIASPGGLPGNDDLGSTSSWYVFSAMGIYPVCPGRPVYAIGAPLFSKVILHLPNGKAFSIRSGNSSLSNNYVQSLTVNGRSWKQLVIPHSELTDGGEMSFTMGSRESNWPLDKDPVVLSETKKSPAFKILNYSVSKKSVVPNESLTVHFLIANTDATGVKIVTLLVNGKPYVSKNCLVPSGAVKKDSLVCRLYPVGKTEIMLEGQVPIVVNVLIPEGSSNRLFKVTDLSARSMVKINEQQQLTYTIQNIGGIKWSFNIPVTKNDTLLFTDTVILEPGEKKQIKHVFVAASKGFQKISADDQMASYKVYKDNTESLLLDLSPINYSTDNLLKDKSGYQNDGHLMIAEKPKTSERLGFDEHTFVEVNNAPSLDNMDETITMMGWIYPTGKERGLVDLITKGDSHVLQVTDHQTLTFFAGGWGRGDCTVNLPAGWNNNWHHIAGVCTGKTLSLYIDGVLAGHTMMEITANLSVSNKWTLGRNEEFPSERIYHGYMDKVKVFKAPLTAEEIHAIFVAEQGDF